MPNSVEVRGTIKDFILREFLEGEDPNSLTDATPLMTSGILDSIATLKMVSFLEKEFQINIAAHEADADHLNTLADMTALVSSKVKA